MGTVLPVHRWFVRAYGGEKGIDTTSVASMLRTNPVYKGLTHPVKKTGDSASTGLVPDFSHRYLSEDIPFGLAVSRGIGELAGVATSMIDKVILWGQQKMGKEYLVSNDNITYTLTGANVKDTHCPQRYGWTDLNSFMAVNM